GIDLATDLTLRIVRDANAARLRNAFKTGGDIDAIAKDVVVIDNDVADVNADAKFNALGRRHRGILLHHGTLHLNGASGGIDRTSELDQHAIAGRLDDPPAMRGDGGIEQGLSRGLEASQYAFFVSTHQAAISGDIRRQNRRKPPFHAIVRHNGPREIRRSVRALSKHRASFLGQGQCLLRVGSGHCLATNECPLWAKSGHWPDRPTTSASDPSRTYVNLASPAGLRPW